MSNLVVEYWPVDRLVPSARNARTHSTEQVAQIAASIREFGWTNPVLADPVDNDVIAGHGRLLAAHVLGMTEVPVIPLTGLSDAKKRALRLADNKLALNAGWDEALLRVEMADLRDLAFDLSLTGFAPPELAAFLDEPKFAPVPESEQGRLDEKKKVACPNCGHEFAPA